MGVVTGATSHPNPPVPVADPPVTLVWIDSKEAIIVRCEDGTTTIERVESDVPARHRATGHERHHPDVHYGAGAGHPHATGDARRLEHLARFIDLVGERLDGDYELIVIGPGTVHEQLAGRVREIDARHRRGRTVRSEAAPRLSRRQLVARAKRASGNEPRRRTVGAYRWSGATAEELRRGMPHRVVEKEPPELARLDQETR